jgi:hypothetical protein
MGLQIKTEEKPPEQLIREESKTFLTRKRKK